jgi:hypothetical protein
MLLNNDTRLSYLSVSGANILADIDNMDLLIYLRHLYLNVAKDLIKSKDYCEQAYGLCHCEAAENVQSIIEVLDW